MVHDIIEVRPLDRYRLALRFDDGVEGVVDVSARVPFDGVFAPLEDPEFFGQVRINKELGTIVWPNGADLDPVVLYRLVKGEAVA